MTDTPDSLPEAPVPAGHTDDMDRRGHGCRAGWFVVLHDMAATFNCVCVPCFSQVLALQEQPSVVAVDIPIGLLTAAVSGGRDCDRMSRSLLGSLRGRSVFSAPVRGALAATTFSAGPPRCRRRPPALPVCKREPAREEPRCEECASFGLSLSHHFSAVGIKRVVHNPLCGVDCVVIP
jgi:hypothetical protein